MSGFISMMMLCRNKKPPMGAAQSKLALRSLKVVANTQASGSNFVI